VILCLHMWYQAYATAPAFYSFTLDFFFSAVNQLRLLCILDKRFTTELFSQPGFIFKGISVNSFIWFYNSLVTFNPQFEKHECSTYQPQEVFLNELSWRQVCPITRYGICVASTQSATIWQRDLFKIQI
jgi:hypothetical protein